MQNPPGSHVDVGSQIYKKQCQKQEEKDFQLLNSKELKRRISVKKLPVITQMDLNFLDDNFERQGFVEKYILN
jgi:hypothetical protein